MNDCCHNQSQGLKAQQHTSTHLLYWVSLLQNNHHLPPPPPPWHLPHPPAPGECIPHKQKKWNMKITGVPLYNKVLSVTNFFLYPSNSKIYGNEPPYNEASL